MLGVGIHQGWPFELVTSSKLAKYFCVDNISRQKYLSLVLFNSEDILWVDLHPCPLLHSQDLRGTEKMRLRIQAEEMTFF